MKEKDPLKEMDRDVRKMKWALVCMAVGLAMVVVGDLGVIAAQILKLLGG